MSQDLKKHFVIAAVVMVFLATYAFTKLPEFAARRHKELAGLREVAVTIPEGLSVGQIGEILEGTKIFSKEEFIKVAQKEEGYLFPDTYRFYKDAKPEDVVGRMKENFNKKITPDVLEEIRKSKRTLREIIIMASMLEEEVRSVEDRRVVAGILWKRFDQGIGLNVDASLTYVLGRASHELTVDDLKYNSPYNTYRYRGLPPTPISNPGLDMILAALRPAISPYFYYLTDKENVMHYAKTLEEHALNKRKYLR